MGVGDLKTLVPLDDRCERVSSGNGWHGSLWRNVWVCSASATAIQHPKEAPRTVILHALVANVLPMWLTFPASVRRLRHKELSQSELRELDFKVSRGSQDARDDSRAENAIEVC